MHINYFKAADKLRFALGDITKLMDSAECKSFEDRKGMIALEDVKGEIEGTIRILDHYSKSPKEGILKELQNGRFGILGNELTCGCSLEIYDQEDEEWYSGRVEHSDGYYFYCHELRNPKLFEGMRARIRW